MAPPNSAPERFAPRYGIGPVVGVVPAGGVAGAEGPLGVAVVGAEGVAVVGAEGVVAGVAARAEVALGFFQSSGCRSGLKEPSDPVVPGVAAPLGPSLGSPEPEAADPHAATSGRHTTARARRAPESPNNCI